MRRVLRSPRRRPRPARVLLLCAAIVGLLPSVTGAHGGFPLRLGCAQDPNLVALSQVIVVSLRDGQGMSVERRVFPDRAALLEAWRARAVDLLVDLPAEEARKALSLSETACGAGIETRIAEVYRNADGPAAVEFFGISLTGSPCGRPGVVVRRTVAENLRYATLRDAVRRAAAAVAKDDLARLVRAAAGGERALVQAVRDLLARKDVR